MADMPVILVFLTITFLQNKVYTEIIGPNGLLISETCRVGFLILGPDIYYPPHNHEATELYHTLSGQGAWQQGDAVEQIKSNDIAIFHDEWKVTQCGHKNQSQHYGLGRRNK